MIKVVWGTHWDALLARDKNGLLMQRMMQCCDGEYQTYKAKDGAYVREHFFNTLRAEGAGGRLLPDDDIWRLNRGGHDPHKVYAAYHAAVNHKGQPTLILAKTIKGYGMGESGEAMNITHQAKKMTVQSLKGMRERFALPLTDSSRSRTSRYLPVEEGSKERPNTGAPAARRSAATCRRGAPRPSRCRCRRCRRSTHRLKASGEGRDIFDHDGLRAHPQTRCCATSTSGAHVVPIVPDESRTFGMEGPFRQLGIWTPGKVRSTCRRTMTS